MIRRPPTLAHDGMVATSHPLATEVGTHFLRRGGHAVDALISAAAVLSVVESSASGLGGDAFFLVDSLGAGRSNVTAINGSGRAPAQLTRERFSGLTDVPLRTPLACTTPGCVAAWEDAWKRWGRLPWSELLAPAISYARDGFPVSWRMGSVVRKMRSVLAADRGLSDLYLDSEGAPLRVGQRCLAPALADTLTLIAEQGAETFYRGEVGERLTKGIRSAGGCLDMEDLAEHQTESLSPYALELGPYTMYEQPLPSQGLLLLIMLGLMPDATADSKNFDPVDELHRQCEAKKVAFALKDAFFSDPPHLPVPHEHLAEVLTSPDVLTRLSAVFDDGPLPQELVSAATLVALEESSDSARKLIEAYKNAGTDPANPPRSGSGATDTTYLCAADRDGNMVGLIQSIFHVFGSGFLEPTTGMVLNNRACGFSLHPNHINTLEPKKKTVHTLNSYLIHRNGEPWLVGGTPGGDNQVQTNLQIVRSLLAGRDLWPGPAPQRPGKWTQERAPNSTTHDFPDLLARALEAPRWRVDPDGAVRIESRMPADIRRKLGRRGHTVKRIGPWQGSGLAQAIARWNSDGLGPVYVGVTDPRGEGVALGGG